MLRLGGLSITSTAGENLLPIMKLNEGLGASDPFQIQTITFYSTTDTAVKIHNTFVPLIAEIPLSQNVANPKQIIIQDSGKAVKIAYAY
jgi:hypothetical protein